MQETDGFISLAIIRIVLNFQPLIFLASTQISDSCLNSATQTAAIESVVVPKWAAHLVKGASIGIIKQRTIPKVADTS